MDPEEQEPGTEPEDSPAEAPPPRPQGDSEEEEPEAREPARPDSASGEAEEKRDLDDKKPGPRSRSIITPLFILAFFVILFLIGQQTIGGKSEKTSLNKFYDMLAKGKIEELEVAKNETKVVLREVIGGTKHLVLKVPESHFLERADILIIPSSEVASAPGLTAEQKAFASLIKNPSPPELRFKTGDSFFLSMLYTFGPLLLIFAVLWFVLFRQMRGPMGAGSILSFGRSKAKLSDKTKNKVTFDDVAGIKEAKEEVQEIIEFLKNPGKFKVIGARIPRGVLLVGQPGTGKTLLAKAIAGEAKVPFYSISGSDFVEMFVGVGASRVRDLFKQAKDNAPCIIFLDEIDAVGRRRGSGLGGGHDEREQTLNAILVEMDGFDTDAGIIMVAATNRPDILDPALLRPGRFDREIMLDLPDLKGREAILKVHARNVKIKEDVDFSIVARMTPMFSGAELESLINEAALLAVMQEKDKVDMASIEEARDKVRWGREKRSRVMSEEDRKITAYHESGHAMLAHLLPNLDPLHKVTIIPRGMALGVTMQLPEKDRYTMRRKHLLNTVKMLLGGLISEQIFCDDITSGSQNDIQNATRLVRLMVCEWGMSADVGPINYSTSRDNVFLGREFSGPKNFSEATAEKIDKEIKRIISQQYEEAKALMLEKKDQVQKLAEALLKHESLSGDDVRQLIEGASVEDLRKDTKSEKASGAGETASEDEQEQGQE